MFSVGTKLFNCSCTESITSSNQNSMAVFVEPKCDFGQVCTFSDTVNSTENNNIRTAFSLCLDYITENIYTSLWGQQLEINVIFIKLSNLCQGLFDGFLHFRCHTTKCTDHFSLQFPSYRLTDLISGLSGYILH